MLRRETGRNILPIVKVKEFNRLRNGLSDFEPVRTDHKAN